jgi:DNA (cytosine-5)-methyltransferase 1
MKLRTLDLFSGIGGFSLGLESTGFFETIGFVEKDKFCQKVLKKHWSNINIEEDIRNVKGEKYQADIVTGGFPCQPFSVAGKRKSTADDRYLWDEMLRVIKETKPRWVIGENVEGIVNINEGMVLRQVLNDLENEGFKSQCIIIPASGIGAWHQRKRIWIIANNISNSDKRNVQTGCERQWGICKEDKRKGTSNNATSICETLSNTNNNGSYRSQGNATKQSSNEQKDRLSFRDDKDVPNTSSQRSSSQSIGEHRELDKESRGKKETRNQSTFCTSSSCSDVPNASNKRLQRFNIKQLTSEQKLGFTSSKNDEGRKTWWQTQSELCGVPNGVSYELDKDRSNRIKALGNSIVPQIARQIGLSIMEAELNGKI